MRHNYDRRHKDGEGRFDRVYVEWPHLWGVSRLIARPMKTVYINRCAGLYAQDKTFTGVNELDAFCTRWNIELL